MIGGSAAELKKELEKVKLFRKKIRWDFGITGGPDDWENHHDEHMKRWKDFNEKESWMYEGTLMFDRN